MTTPELPAREAMEFDTVIVGAGPTGLTLACDLARRGVPFRIVDKATEPFTGSRGKGVQPRTLEVFDDLALVPDVISCGHHVDTEIEKLFRQRGRDSEPRGGIFAVGNDQIGGVPLAQFGQAIFYNRPSGPAKNVTDKKNFQESGLRS